MNGYDPVRMKDILTHLPPYTEKDDQVAFLLGGIGTGNVSIGSRGQLMDWELYNKPGKGNRMPYTMFTLHAQCDGVRDTRVVEAAIQPPYAAARGDMRDTAGLPRMRHSTFRAEYPFVLVEFVQESLPVQISMEAYTPFIPLNSEDSGIPGAIIRFRVKNLRNVPVFASVAGSLANITSPISRNDYGYLCNAGKARNRFMSADGLTGLFMTSEDYPEDHPLHGSLTLCTTAKACTSKPVFYKGNWRDGIQDFWNDFSADGMLDEVSADDVHCSKIRHEDGLEIGAIAPYQTLAPGEETIFEFILSWSFPNRIRAWKQIVPPTNETPSATIRNFYAIKFPDAWKAAAYLKSDMPRLEKDTLAFHNALFDSTYPPYVLDALASNITALRSPTCFRLENGTFMAWEGCNDQRGSCDGTCTHVWNYAQTVAFLFPDLEVSARVNEFTLETEADGKMNFRARKMLKDFPWKMPAAVDGQNGTIVRLYREWKITGDDRIIDDLGENVLKSMDYCINEWDADRDGLLSGEQHNTYDIEFFGISSLANTMYYAALRAAEEIAGYLGRVEKAREYRELWLAGARRMDKALWNGEYYVQEISDEDLKTFKYQYGKGCLADQVLGQFMAHLSGLGYILPKEHIRKAVESIYRYNFRQNLEEHVNPQRAYALGDEAGLLLCTWPHGGRPRFPFIYSDEVWTGIEYQVAASLIWEDLVEEGLKVVEAVRNRHDGHRRNPFDEFECGHHYARSLASWSILIALSGFEVGTGHAEPRFNPKINRENFRTFYSTGKQWGVYSQTIDESGNIRREIKPFYNGL